MYKNKSKRLLRKTKIVRRKKNTLRQLRKNKNISRKIITRRRRVGGSRGSDYRQKLVNLCKRKQWEAYDDLTNKIIDDYISGDHQFFLHLNKNFNTFSKTTKLCLTRALTRLQEEAIPESMPYLHSIMMLSSKSRN
jgi:hypothetical protein